MKDEFSTDWRATLAHIAKVGFRELEFPGFFGPSPQACRAALDGLGLIALGGGAVYRELLAHIDEILATSQTLGKRYVCCYWPWLDSGEHKTADDWKRVGDAMNALGARVRAGGLTLAYHNHDKEFLPLTGAGSLPYDILLAHTDPALVSMQLDLWWVDKGGADPIPFLRQHHGRFAIFHIKERLNTAENGWACTGSTYVNLPAVLRAGLDAGVGHFIVENENPQAAFACAEDSLRKLSSLRL